MTKNKSQTPVVMLNLELMKIRLVSASHYYYCIKMVYEPRAIKYRNNLASHAWAVSQ
jgi:hypothetical protein